MNSKTFSMIVAVILLASCAPVATPVSTPMATVTRIPTTTPIPTPTPHNTPTEIPTYTPVVIAPLNIYQSANVNYWAQQIAKNPKDANAYYQKALAMFQSNRAIGSLDDYITRLNLNLQDIDTAISLNPDIGDYYTLRQNIYNRFAGTTDYIVESQYWSRLALENAQKAYQLGTTDDYPERTIVNDLIASGHCDEALKTVQKLITELPSGDISLGGLLHIRSRAYACLGRLNNALQSVNDSMFNNENMEYKNELKAQYLILLGRYDEALPILDERICHCQLSGWHYYLRAEIYYRTGKKDQVQDQLFIGMTKTWGRGGMLPYVEAQLALNEGRKSDAIQLLQFAEATFSDPIYNTLRWKVQKQLRDLGAQPLAITPSVEVTATSIP